MIGKNIAQYEVLAKLGAGGMGEVYRARDSRLGRDVAMKVLLAEAAKDRDRLARFLAEARAVSALNHPNIVTLHEIGECERGPYLVTELVEGRTVRELLADGPISVELALDIAGQAAAGLAKAHEAGVVHRDIKPENLMVTPDGLVKILDFGLAKLTPAGESGVDHTVNLKTAPGTLLGTPPYLSPEQLHGRSADPRTDVYALGLVLYEMLAGENPFLRGAPLPTMTAILHEELPPLRGDVPPGLEAIVRKATAKDADRRHADARELANALRTLGTPAARSPRRAITWVGIAAVVFVVALLVRGLDRGAPEDEPSRTTVARPARVLPEGKTGVMVLPIRDESGDDQLARAGFDGILTNAFVRLLGELPDLHVNSHARLETAAHARGRPVEETETDPEFARVVGTDADAGALLTGSLARDGGQLVLSASLVELPSEAVRRTFEVRAAGPESLLAELNRAVGVARVQPLEGGPGSRVGAAPSIEAYTHYLRGAELVEQGLWMEAVPELEAAVRADPEMALAWSALACAYSFGGDDTKARAANRVAHDHLDRATEQERRWIALDKIWVETGNGDRYLEEMDAYIRDFPDDPNGYHYAGLAEEYLRDDPLSALAWYEQAYALKPIYYPITQSIVDVRQKLGQGGEAVAALRRYLDQPYLKEHARAKAESRLRELEGS